MHALAHETAIQILGTRIPSDAELTSLGIDSIVAIEFVSNLKNKFCQEISLAEFLALPTLGAVVDALHAKTFVNL